MCIICYIVAHIAQHQWSLFIMLILWLLSSGKLLKSWFFYLPDLCRTPLRLRDHKLRCSGLWVISWGCCSVLEVSPEHRWGWHSVGSWLCWPHPPSFSGSPPPSAAASPAGKTSHSLCQGAPLYGYCSVLQDKSHREAGINTFLFNLSTNKDPYCSLSNIVTLKQ